MHLENLLLFSEDHTDRRHSYASGSTYGRGYAERYNGRSVTACALRTGCTRSSHSSGVTLITLVAFFSLRSVSTGGTRSTRGARVTLFALCGDTGIYTAYYPVAVYTDVRSISVLTVFSVLTVNAVGSVFSVGSVGSVGYGKCRGGII